MKNSILFLLSALVPLYAQECYEMTHMFTLANKGVKLTRICAVMPVPQTNNYQEIRGYQADKGKVLTAEANTANQYLRDVQTSHLPKGKKNYTLSQTYHVTLYPVYVDMEQFDKLYPYDTTSDLYRRYTSGDGKFIDFKQPFIRKVSNELWKSSDGHVLRYAYACYLHVAENFRYLNANTGIHPMASILQSRGGDCGNLSSVFVTLLRAKGIPAKHVVTVRPDGTYHVWADFYLEKYGWIPVDVSARQADPQGNYFGYCKGDGVVVSEDICTQIQSEPKKMYNAVLLQTYCYWYSCKGASRKITTHFRISGTPTQQKPVVTATRTQNHTARVSWPRMTGASGYRLQVAELDTETVVQTYEVNRETTEKVLEGVDSAKAYRLLLTPLRKVDNFMSAMGTYEVQL